MRVYSIHIRDYIIIIIIIIGARASTKKVLILLTDGAQTPSKNAEDPGSIVEVIRHFHHVCVCVCVCVCEDPGSIVEVNSFYRQFIATCCNKTGSLVLILLSCFFYPY